MADMHGFGAMDPDDRGGPHAYGYEDAAARPATPGATPSQTVGPFFAYGLTPGPYGYAFPEMHRTDLADERVEGERVTVTGRVLDAQGAPVHDAVVEIWQADASGAFVTEPRNDGFTGFGRAGTGPQGPKGDTRFRFRTIRPGGAAPVLNVAVLARGMLNHGITRMYFPEGALEDDPVLAQVPEARRATLIARAEGDGAYAWDIRLSGEGETVFFDV